MKKYLSFLRIRLINGLQYRAAAYAGVATQFTWGAMELLLYRAFYQANDTAFPMTYEALAAYIWMQQAFLTLFMPWIWEEELFRTIENGDVAYELCRPISIYGMWFSRCIASRLSKAALRCMPILIVAFFLPAPYGICLPADGSVFVLFLITMLLGLLDVVAFSMLIYMSAFFMIQANGVRMMVNAIGELLSGAVIPLPFLPDFLRNIVELLPLAMIQNVPLRVYSGDISGMEVYQRIALQIFWLFVMVLIGKWMERRVMKKVVVQGG